MGKQRAQGRTRLRALYRRAALFILDPNPPLWGRALVCFVIAAALLAFAFVTQSQVNASSLWVFYASQDSSGAWHINTSPFSRFSLAKPGASFHSTSVVPWTTRPRQVPHVPVAHS